MLSADEHPGIFMFMVGMIVLVMSAVGLSVLMDKHGQHSKGARATTDEIAASTSEISELNARRDRESAALADLQGKLASGAKQRGDLATRLADFQQRHDALEMSRSTLAREVDALDRDFTTYRSKYRSQVRAAAPGESLGDLKVRGGRVYSKATITRVTDVGLEIHHDSGIARIQAPDLDAAIQDRFQWTDEERRDRLKEENAAASPAVDEPEKTTLAVRPTTPRPAAPAKPKVDPEALRLARQQVSAWTIKVGTLASEQQEAASRGASGGRASVPGSLETWAAKADRMGREVARARMSLALAKANLEAISPRDPLLRTPDAEY